MAKKKVSPMRGYKLKDGTVRYEFPVYLGVDPLTSKQKRTKKRALEHSKKRS